MSWIPVFTGMTGFCQKWMLPIQKTLIIKKISILALKDAENLEQSLKQWLGFFI
jgi:hypothetical protein